MSNKRYAILLPVGPNEKVERVQDLWESIHHYEPAEVDLVVVDDAPGGPRDWAKLVGSNPRATVHSIRNPRNGKGVGWSGGLCTALMEGFKWIDANLDCAFTLRLDSDSIICGPFYDRVLEALKGKTGVVGTYTLRPSGEARMPHPDATPANAIWVNKIARSFAVLRTAGTLFVHQGLIGGGRLRRRIVNLALKNGYQAGWFVQGGGYAVSREAIAAMRNAGFFKNTKAFLPARLGEDTAATILVYAAGFEGRDLNQPGDPFAVELQHVMASPRELVQSGYAIVHSLKKGPKGESEEQIRQQFQELRQGVPARG